MIMSKKMYFVNFDWEGFIKGEFDIIINDISTQKYFVDYINDKYKTKIFIEYPNNGYSVFSAVDPMNRLSQVYELSLEIPPLTFLGRGSAFNTKEGNTSAYFKYDNNTKMILIDCGSTVFSKLIEHNVLEGIEELNVCITHTHPDHIGSLGDLIFYMYYMRGIEVNLILSDKQYNNINLLLAYQGIPIKFYNKRICDMKCSGYTSFIINDNLGIILYPNHNHCEDSTPEIISINNNKTINNNMYNSICYTGDLCKFNHIKNIICIYCPYSMVYIEACEPNKGNGIHYPIDKLINDIPKEERKYFTLMHFDSDKTIEMAKDAGFNIAMTLDEKIKFERQTEKEKINKAYYDHIKDMADHVKDPLEPIKEYHGIIDDDTNEKFNKHVIENINNHNTIEIKLPILNYNKVNKNKNIIRTEDLRDLRLKSRLCYSHSKTLNNILSNHEFLNDFKNGNMSIFVRNNIRALKIILQWIKNKFDIDLFSNEEIKELFNQTTYFSFTIFYNYGIYNSKDINYKIRIVGKDGYNGRYYPSRCNLIVKPINKKFLIEKDEYWYEQY